MDKEKIEKMIAEGLDPVDADLNDDSNFTGSMLIATVKGNVHDMILERTSSLLF
jgi:cobalamin-dependent methionine synthase I